MTAVYVLTEPGNSDYIGEADDADAAIVLAEQKGFVASNFGCVRMSMPAKTDFFLVYPAWLHQGKEN